MCVRACVYTHTHTHLYAYYTNLVRERGHPLFAFSDETE